MRRLLIIVSAVLALILPSASYAAHTSDTKAQTASYTNSNPTTLSYTCGSGTTLLVVLIAHTQTSRSGGAPTYNSVALTQAGSEVLNQQEVGVEMWYMTNPPTGASYTISVPNSTAQNMRVSAASFKAASGYQSVIDGTATTDNVDKQNPSLNRTPSVAGDVCVNLNGHGSSDSPSSRSHTEIYTNDEGLLTFASQYALSSDTSTVTMTFNYGGSDDVANIMACFKEQSNTVALSATSTLGTSARGTLGVSVSVPGDVSLPTKLATSTSGTMTVTGVHNETVALSGLPPMVMPYGFAGSGGTSSRGTMSASSTTPGDVSLTGKVGTSARDTLTIGVGYDRTLVGELSTSARGTLTATSGVNETVNLATVAGTSARGTLKPDTGVAYLGYQSFNTDSTGNHSITVPAGTDAAVLSWSCYNGATEWFGVTAASIDGESFTEATSKSAVQDVSGGAGQMYLVGPSIGSQTLSTTCTNSSDGCQLVVTYWSGVDQISPIRGADSQPEAGSPGLWDTTTTDAMTAAADDYAIVAVFGGTSPDPEADADGQTQITALYNSNWLAVGIKEITSGSSTTMTGEGNYTGLAAVVLAAASRAKTIALSTTGATASRGTPTVSTSINGDVNLAGSISTSTRDTLSMSSGTGATVALSGLPPMTMPYGFSGSKGTTSYGTMNASSTSAGSVNLVGNLATSTRDTLTVSTTSSATANLTGSISTSTRDTLAIIAGSGATAALTGSLSTSTRDTLAMSAGSSINLPTVSSTSTRGNLSVSYGGAATANLTGELGTSTRGTPALSVDQSVALSTTSATSSRGTMPVSADAVVALRGIRSVAPGHFRGSQSTASAGTLDVSGDAAITLAGKIGSSSRGAPTLSVGNTIALATTSGTSARGTVTVDASSGATASLTGSIATASRDTLALSVDQNVALTSPTSSSIRGDMTVSGGQSNTINLATTLGTSNRGTLSVAGNATISPALDPATSSHGSLAADAGGGQTVLLSPTISTSTRGTPTVTGVRNQTISLTGAVGTSIRSTPTITAGEQDSVALSTTSGTSARGTLARSVGYDRTLDTRLGTALAGTIVPMAGYQNTANLSTALSTGSTGTVTVGADVEFSVTGAEASASRGIMLCSVAYFNPAWVDQGGLVE